MKYKPKIKNKLCVCKTCGKEFLAADVKAKQCPECYVAAFICECGAPKDRNAKYCSTCRNTKYSHTRGKTYEEIMGVDKATILREQKVFSFKSAAKPVDGYRSLYEKTFADFLNQNHILFEYEAKLQGIEKSWSKLVDFFLPQQKLYIELSGYIWAHPDRDLAQEKFLSRLLEVASLLPEYQFIIATEPSLLPTLQAYFEGYYPFRGRPILILSLQELRQYILSLGEAQ